MIQQTLSENSILFFYYSYLPTQFMLPSFPEMVNPEIMNDNSGFASSQNPQIQQKPNPFPEKSSLNSENKDSHESEQKDHLKFSQHQLNQELAPTKKWTYEEDEELKNYVQVEGLRWNEIISKMPDRTYQMCYSRYQRIKREKRKNWSIVEEKKLTDLVETIGKKWKKISELIPGRTAKQIRERYLNHLQPHISHRPWTQQQDEHLMNLVKEYGRQWRVIESFMGNRSQNQLKNRFYGKLRLEGIK